MRLRRLLVWLVLAAVLGFTVFGVLVWQATTVTPVDAPGATAAFAEARAALGNRPPLLQRDEEGRLRRTPGVQPGTADPAPEQLVVLAFHAAGGSLVRAEVPFWFFALKEPAVRLVLRDTGFDLVALGLTTDDLRAFGQGLLLDESDAAGDRLLVWLE